MNSFLEILRALASCASIARLALELWTEIRRGTDGNRSLELIAPAPPTSRQPHGGLRRHFLQYSTRIARAHGAPRVRPVPYSALLSAPTMSIRSSERLVIWLMASVNTSDITPANT